MKLHLAPRLQVVVVARSDGEHQAVCRFGAFRQDQEVPQVSWPEVGWDPSARLFYHQFLTVFPTSYLCWLSPSPAASRVERSLSLQSFLVGGKTSDLFLIWLFHIDIETARHPGQYFLTGGESQDFLVNNDVSLWDKEGDKNSFPVYYNGNNFKEQNEKKKAESRKQY